VLFLKVLEHLGALLAVNELHAAEVVRTQIALSAELHQSGFDILVHEDGAAPHDH
jgi:hypothetical protein